MTTLNYFRFGNGGVEGLDIFGDVIAGFYWIGLLLTSLTIELILSFSGTIFNFL